MSQPRGVSPGVPKLVLKLLGYVVLGLGSAVFGLPYGTLARGRGLTRKLRYFGGWAGQNHVNYGILGLGLAKST